MNKLILHISTSFTQNELYSNLINEIHELGVKQIVYAPTRYSKDLNKNYKLNREIELYVSHILRKWHKIFFNKKITDIFVDIEKKINLHYVTTVHAHFLYSDGGVAYEINKKYKIPYVVTVRNTDVNYYFKYRKDLLPYMFDILNNAKKIIFISVALKNYFYTIVSKYVGKAYLDSKSIVIPNGVDPTYINNSCGDSYNVDEIRLIYVGDFSKNKNLLRVLHALDELIKITDVNFTVIGGGRTNVVKQCKKRKYVRFLGRIDNKDLISKELCQHNIFIMPSIYETFGLAYVEALFHGLPVICSKGQGIDGFFHSKDMVVTVNPKSVESIKKAIISLYDTISNYKERPTYSGLNIFFWDKIALQYVELYSA